MPKRPYPRHQRRHTAILIAALENPAQTQKQIAKTTGYSESRCVADHVLARFPGDAWHPFAGSRSGRSIQMADADRHPALRGTHFCT